MESKEEFFIPWIPIDENIEYIYRPAMSFEDFKNMVDIDLLEFKKLGCDILIDEKILSTLVFMKDWRIYNGKPYLTNRGIKYLFRGFQFVYLKFLEKYTSFVWTNSLSKELNGILETKKRYLEYDKEFKRERILQLKKMAEESEIHNEYIREFIPNFFKNSYKNMEVI